MVMKRTAVCLVALALLGSFGDAQWGDNTYKPAKPVYPPKPQEPSKKVPYNPQSKQSFEKPLTWVYPEDPKPEPQPEVPFELRHPVAAATVNVVCRERDARVEAKKDLFGTGQFINPLDLTLGNCAVDADDTAQQLLIFEPQLHECGSVALMLPESIVYTFTLNYNPRDLGGRGVVRTTKAAVIVECYYPRNHNVSSLAIEPLWIPYSAVKLSEEFLYFSLRLMTDDWNYERPSIQYYLGEMINIEAAVKQYFHVPLRVYVDRCVATVSSDISSTPKYAFIDNHGCFVDALITASASKFMTRTADYKLQFQLEPFRFLGIDSEMVYITCHLKASSVSYLIDSEHRACSFISGWREASGADAACTSCDAYVAAGSSSGVVGSGGATASWGGSAHHERKIRDASKKEIVEWEGDVTLGPISIRDKPIA